MASRPIWRSNISTPPSTRRALLQVLATAPLIGPATDAAHAAQAPSENADTITPEQFGAIGDGIADDSSAIQRVLDAVAARRRPGMVTMRPRVAYRCDHGLTLDASHVSISGHGLLDFARCKDVCLRVNASSVAAGFTPANNYGHRGMISGALSIRGGGRGTTATGILFDSDTTATAAQLLLENVSVSGCTTGIEFGRRAYNNVFLRCDIFDCGRCVLWRDADDNGERNTLIGCALYNSALAVRMEQAAGALYLESCSLDYTQGVYDVVRGSVFATDCHHESKDWTGRPFRCHTDGAVIHLTGGILLGQATPQAADALFEVGAGASARVDGMFIHNISLTTAPDRPPPFAVGPGHFALSRSESFDTSGLPARLHEGRTMLADPDFAAPAWQDPVWRVADGARPIASRHGVEGDGLRLARANGVGGSALRVAKHSPAGTPAAFTLLSLPIRPGEQVMAGFRVRLAQGRGGRFDVQPSWTRIDGQDASSVPTVTRRDVAGVAPVTPGGDGYALVMPMGGRTMRTAPSWATHFLLIVDVSQLAETELMFRSLWCDTM